MPYAGLDPVRVGPEEIKAGDRASKMVGKFGVHNAADELIKQSGLSFPKELMLLQQKPEDRPRTVTLDLDEVEEVLAEQIGEKQIGQVLSGRVHGANGPDSGLQVVVLFERPSGRTTRAAVMYADLPNSRSRFESATSDGTMIGLVHERARAEDFERPAPLSDAEKAKAGLATAAVDENAELKQKLAAIERENAELKAAQSAPPAAPEPVASTPPATTDAPVPTEDGGSEASTEEPPPAPAEEVTLPEGLLKTIGSVKEGIGSLSDEQLTLAEKTEKKGDKRKGALDAIKAERDSRTD